MHNSSKTDCQYMYQILTYVALNVLAGYDSVSDCHFK